MPKPFRFIAGMPRLNQPVAQWRDELRRIEDLGFDTVAISDHFTGGWVMDPIVAMTTAAASTSRLRVLSLVLSNDYRHPVQLHKSMATLDVLSGGRVEIGLGAGWLRAEYEAAGLPFDAAGVRIERLAESIEVIRGLFADKPLYFYGRHYRIEAIDGLPKPVQDPGPPLLVGGGGRRMLELAGRVADIVSVNPALPPEQDAGSAILDMTADRVDEKLRWARGAATAAGRDPDDLQYEIAVRSLTVTDGPPTTWVSTMADAVTDPALIADSPAVLHGTVDECVDLLIQRRERFGFNYIDVGSNVAVAAPIVARLAGR
jgi:probable F420-dependent oxidoreductase